MLADMMSDPYHAFANEESTSSNRGRRSVGADEGGRVGWGLVLPALACAESCRRSIGRLNSSSTMGWEWPRNLILDRRRLSRQFCSEKKNTCPLRRDPALAEALGVEGLRPEAAGFGTFVCHVCTCSSRYEGTPLLPHYLTHDRIYNILDRSISERHQLDTSPKLGTHSVTFIKQAECRQPLAAVSCEISR